MVQQRCIIRLGGGERGTYFREERGHLSDSSVDLLRTRNKARGFGMVLVVFSHMFVQETFVL